MGYLFKGRESRVRDRRKFLVVVGWIGNIVIKSVSVYFQARMIARRLDALL